MTESDEFDPSGSPLQDPAHAYVVTNANVAANCRYVRTSHDLQHIIRVEWRTHHPHGDDIAGAAHLGVLMDEAVLTHRARAVEETARHNKPTRPGAVGTAARHLPESSDIKLE